MLALLALYWACGRATNGPSVVLPPASLPAPVDRWAEAISKVEEDRGEPVGREAEVEVPPELKHHSDRRRFLALQVAEWRRLAYQIPHDFAHLTELIRQSQLVEMEPLGEDYVLYGVGHNASDAPFTHYDPRLKSDAPIYTNRLEGQKQLDSFALSLVQLRARVEELKQQIASTPRREAALRKTLIQQRIESAAQLAEIERDKEAITDYWARRENRKLLESEDRVLSELAADLGGVTYDLANSEDRRRLKVRLLGFIRPHAREVLLELARAYNSEFDRPLPVGSLIRTAEYQHQLGQTNKNAVRMVAPPHATGLAFDIYDAFMPAAEQDFLMKRIAGLEAAGKVEALREQRDHIHVFVFVSEPVDAAGVVKKTPNQAAGRAQSAGVIR
jgi:hypothetical protein